MQQFSAKVLSNKKLAPEHYLLTFKAPKIARETNPGQFFNIRVETSFSPLLRRPFSVHRIGRGQIEILYKVVGKATAILSSKRKGDILDVIGPLGNGFNIEMASSALLIAGGHGVAPLYALAEELTAYKQRRSVGGKNHLHTYIHCEVVVMLGARSKKYLICERGFKRLGAKVYVATEDGTKGHKGFVTELLEEHFDRQTGKPANRLTIYACGPRPMLKTVAGFARHYDISCQFSFEEYMACGIGTCLGCAIKTRNGYKLVCKDGPVFDPREIVW